MTRIALMVAAGVSVMAGATAAGQAGTTVKLTKAALTAEAKTDQRQMIVPAAGRKFLWISTEVSGAATTIDLTKVAVTAGAASFPLIGVDSAYDGDPSQFSMIAKATLKDTGASKDPLEETRSVGSTAFAFTPGKVASLKANTPPVSFCLLFSVPASFTAGQVKGLGPAALAVPALTK